MKTYEGSPWHADEDEEPEENRTLQFRLSTIFSITVIASVLTAFLSRHGNDLILAGAVSMVASLVFGLAVGYVRPPLADRVFWGVVVAAMMEVVCATVILFDHGRGIYAWPIAAGFAAVTAANSGKRFQRMFVAAATSGAIISIYAFSTTDNPLDVLAIVACAAIGGALLAILIESMSWLEQTYKIPSSLTGLGLVLAAIVFSVIGKHVIPGW